MPRWHEALRAYRLALLDPDPFDALPGVMFVLCSESHHAAALVAACRPALVLQTFGGVKTPFDPSIRATFEYAVIGKGVRQVVICGHEGCQAVPRDAVDPRSATQRAVVAQCDALRNDPDLGRLLREYRVVVRPLWFDVAEGDLFLCNLEDSRLQLVGDDDFARLVGQPLSSA